MYDGIFFVNHAINAPKRATIFNEQERYQQTLETIDSINKYCPNNKIFLFDSSPYFPNKKYIQGIIDKDVLFLYNGDDIRVNQHSLKYQKSIAECVSFKIFIKWFKKHKKLYKAKRIYKLSGRYKLNDNFVLNDSSYKDAFVFLKPVDANLDYNKKEIPNWKFYNFNTYYNLRLWHMDYSLLDVFENEINNILRDCAEYKIDVEYAYYKNLHTYKTIELDKIGVCGNIAHNGRYIEE